MRPNDSAQDQPIVNVPSRDGYSLVPSRPNPASAGGTSRSSHQSQEATANLARRQLDSIYSNDPDSLMDVEAEPSTITPHPQSQPRHAYAMSEDELQAASQQSAPAPQTSSVDSSTDTPRRFGERTIQPISPPEPAPHDPAPQKNTDDLEVENPYARTHDDSQLHANPAGWQEYHSAWQQYYQQYFHHYYSSHLEAMNQKLAASTSVPTTATNSQEVTPEEAMDDIRSRIRSTVKTKASQVRKSRHFVPVAAAFGVMLVVGFLQYNSVLFSNLQAYVMPGNVSPPSLIVETDPTAVVGPDPLLVIDKINVEVPVVWNARPDHDSQMAAMERGVAWFGIPGANSKPGQVGNTVLSGHSSNDFFDNGQYKFVFAPLDKLVTGDSIDIHYQGTLYTYVVTKKEVVKPTDVQALIYETDKPMLTLITCTPLGTALNRLLVTAEQVSPSPSDAEDAPESSSGEAPEMPGTEPTVIERIFGA